MLLDGSVWVLASAGSGKTKNLIDRIVALLVHGVRPSKILCLTYTKNATSEMLARLNDRIIKWHFASEDVIKQDLLERRLSSDLYKRAKQLYTISMTEKWVRVQTIHGFCQELINMYPLESGIMPNSKVLDDILPFLQAAYIRVLNNSQFHDDLEFVLQYKGALLEIITGSFHDIRKFFNRYNWDKTAGIYEQFFEVKYKSETDILSELCTTYHQELIEMIKPYFADNMDILNAFPTFDISRIFLTAEGKPNSKVLKASANKTVAIEIAELADLAHDLNEHRNRLLISHLNTSFMNIAYEVVKEYDELKKASNMIDFDDIVNKANYIMKNYDYIRQSVDGMLDHVLIDEAQDTSALQWEVIKSITGDFFENENSNKTIFVVGDSKQSIYSFQGADYELFLSMHDYFKQRVMACGQEWHDITLNKSYRSGQAIIDFVNNSFRNVFSNSEHFTARTGCKSQVTVNPVRQITADNTLTTIAYEIASSIKKMIDSHVLLPSKNRAARPRDFMILSQRRSELNDLISDELKRLGIACSGSDKIDIKAELIVEDLISIAKFSMFQYDDMNLAIILKSPIIDISENELFEICTKRGEQTIWQYIIENCNELFNKLSRYVTNSRLPPYEFFMKLVEYGDIEVLASRDGNNSLEVFNLFLDICKQYNGPASLSSFIRWYNKTQFTTKKDKLSSDDSVSIMTVHGSKGLQSPVVIVIDTAFVNRKYSPITNCGNDFIFLNHTDFYTSRTDSIAEIIRDKENAESKRLLYVAMTRAEDVLSIYAHTALKKINQNAWYSIIGGEQQFGEVLDVDGNYIESVPTITNRYPELQPLAPLENERLDKTQPEIYGDFVHLLLEKLPDLPKTSWNEFIDAQHSLLNDSDKQAAIGEALKVLDVFADIFNHSIASELDVTTNGHLRRIDKVCLINNEIYIIDFKTGLEETLQYTRQLTEYKKILSTIFLKYPIRAFTLWTKSLELRETVIQNSEKNISIRHDLSY